MGIFSGLFSKKSTRSEVAAELSRLGCDIHSHFIPGIDDGAKDMEDSIGMLRSFSEMGYKKVITTPHVMSDYYRNTSEIILSGLEKVREELKKQQIPLEIDAAAEYYLDFEVEKKIKDKSLLTFGKNYVLFELSFVNPPDNLYHTIFNMLTAGYKPVLAHPERYNFWHDHFEKYEEFFDKGVLLQLNINSLSGHYSPQTKKIAEMMIEKNMISFLGSDCHHMGHVDLMKQVVYENALHKLLASGKLLNSTL